MLLTKPWHKIIVFVSKNVFYNCSNKWQMSELHYFFVEIGWMYFKPEYFKVFISEHVYLIFTQRVRRFDKQHAMKHDLWSESGEVWVMVGRLAVEPYIICTT